MRFSIIMPVLNEESVLGQQLAHLMYQCARHDCELLIVDGGSLDSTVAVARSYGQVIRSSSRHATQMNVGASVAIGDVLIFLYADTQLPDDAFSAIQGVIARVHAAEHVYTDDVTVKFGHVTFKSPRTLVLDGEEITSRAILIATGSHPAVPMVEGLAEVGYLTNEDVFSLTSLPASIIVVGGDLSAPN